MSTATTHIKTDKQLVPALRFDGFNTDWSNLSSPIQIVAGNAYSLDDYVDEGKMLVQGLNIGPGKLKLDSPYYISEQLETKHVTLKKDDILLGLNRPITNGKLKVCKYDLAKESYLYQRAGKLEFNSTEINSEFLYQLIRSNYFLKEISIELVGSDQPYIRSNLFKVIKLWFPEFPEQQKIASFLSVVDEKIQQLTKKKALLEQYKKGVMQQLFSGQLRFKDQNGNTYPDWEEKRLGEIGDLKNGLNKDKKDFGFGSLFVNLMDVFGKCELNNQKFDLVNSNEKEKELYNVLKGDVLFIRSSVKRTGVGETVIVQEDLPNTVYSGFLIRFRDDRKSLYQDYKKYCFASHDFRKELLSYATSSANTNINQESLNKIRVVVPIIEEQQKIATYLSGIDTKIEAVNNQITQTQTFKKGLLQQMFVAA